MFLYWQLGAVLQPSEAKSIVWSTVDYDYSKDTTLLRLPHPCRYPCRWFLGFPLHLPTRQAAPVASLVLGLTPNPNNLTAASLLPCTHDHRRTSMG